MSDPWTPAQKRALERALGTVPDDAPDRWEQIAAKVPGRSLEEIQEGYELLVHDVVNIDEGPAPVFIEDCVPEPVANDSSSSQKITKRTSPNQSEKKVPWTDDEHRNFLRGLKKYGKGQWKRVSRECLPTKTPTQIASHAQKYYLRLNSTPKKRKRASIHDLTIDDTDLVPQQNQVPQLNAPLQQLSPQQNRVQLDAPMKQLSSQQNQVDALDFPTQQLSFQQNGDPPLNFPHQVFPQQNCATPLNVQQLSPQQNGHPPLNFPMQQLQEIQQSDLASQQHMVPPLDAPMQQLQERQHTLGDNVLASEPLMVPPLDAPMQHLQERQHTLGDNVLASEPLMVPPLDAPMQHLQERQHTLGDSALASQQHLVPPVEVMPMQQLQERPHAPKGIDSRNFVWKPFGNRGR